MTIAAIAVSGTRDAVSQYCHACDDAIMQSTCFMCHVPCAPCSKLAALHSAAVDYAKTSEPVVLHASDRPKVSLLHEGIPQA